jgi:DNA ligase-1
MLAVPGKPFDSPEHLFEVKWNGIRALTAIDHGDWRLWGREPGDYRPRYPELEVLGGLPDGTILDGELVILGQGPPRLENILRRHLLVDPWKIQRASRTAPASYVLFDLLYHRGRSLLDEPLTTRRELLEELLQRYGGPRLALSQGIVGAGGCFFERAVAEGHEGLMAKHLAGRYWPGRRTPAWRKIKPRRALPCLVLGYTSCGQKLRSLLVAAEWQGVLRYAGHVHAGLSTPVQGEILAELTRRVRATPLIDCPRRATWVAPEFYVHVAYVERTVSGCLRGARFVSWIRNGS